MQRDHVENLGASAAWQKSTPSKRIKTQQIKRPKTRHFGFPRAL
jgi:hypothetical protein